ncbi:hypothetical protein DL765_011046 [Monosporascus sp. GIB2]|nr:hypothetical protein DL765_011046 [Monosporascus sp. GIB2]
MNDFQSSIGSLRQSPVAATEELPTPGDSRGSSVYNLPTDNSIHVSKVAYPDLIEEAGPSWIDEKSIRIAQKTDNGQWGLVGRKPKDEPWKIARERCHAVAISVLKHFDAMNTYWDERLSELNTMERKAIINKLRLQFPLIIAKKGASSQALIGQQKDDLPTVIATEPHPRGHGLIAKDDMYDAGIIKFNGEILVLLERYEEILQDLPAAHEGYHRCADNLRALTAALFYTFAFQLADIIAPRAYWHLEYTELKRGLAGLGLQARVFNGELQLRYRRVYKEELMQQFSPVLQEMLTNQPAPVGHPPEGMDKSTAERIQMIHSLVQMMSRVFDGSKEKNIEDHRAKEWKLFTKLYSPPQYIHKDNNQEYEKVWKQFKPRA